MQHPELGWKCAITQFSYSFQIADPSGISTAFPLQWIWELHRDRRQCWQTTLPSQQEWWNVHKYTCHGKPSWWEWRMCSFNQCWHIANNSTFTFMTVFVLWRVCGLHSTQGWWLYCHRPVSFQLNTEGTVFFTCKECHKAFEIILLQTKRRRTIGRPKKLRREQLLLSRRNRSKGPILDDYDNDDGGKSLPSFSTTTSSRYSVSSMVL